MKVLAVVLVVTSALTSVAYAADKLEFAPHPSWVTRVDLPSIPAKSDGAPIHIILSDQQVLLEKDRQTTYTETALKIETPQGLAAGNISLRWRPEFDTLTVHKLLIRREGQTIDVLKSGQTFTVLRREQNLESAMLDGILTANILPEGLQVGDTLEIATSLSTSDPTMKGHVEQVARAWNGLPIGRAHLRVQWPSNLHAQVRQIGALPQLRPTKSGNITFIEFSQDDLRPVAPPKLAPARYQIARAVEVSDFASWADLGALMAPLYQKASDIPAEGPLRAELQRIEKLSNDPKVRAEAALALVQDRVRYVALTMGAGGYVPADAEATWARRYGDCKGKTALLIALLKGLQIDAEAVAVSTIMGDGIDARLPMVSVFNHVLVRANLGGRTYWLDGTRSGDTSLDRLATPNFGWGLPLVSQGAALVRMLPAPLEQPDQDTVIRMDASAGIAVPAPTRIETILRGDDAMATNRSLVNLAGEARDRALKEYWKNRHDFIDIKTVSAAFDAKTGEQRLIMEGLAKMDWSAGYYETDDTGVGYRADFSRDPGPNHDAPFAVSHPFYSRTIQTIVLPKSSGDFKIGTGTQVDETVAGIHYRRHAAIKDNVFTIEKTERSIVFEFPARDAPAAQAALVSLADRSANLRKPADYKASNADVGAVGSAAPSTAAAYRTRAEFFVEQGMKAEAIADFSKAIELDPTDILAWSNRATLRIETGDLVGGRADLAKAELLDPDYDQVFVAKGILADAENRPNDAVEAYTKVLQQEPDHGYALTARAAAYAALGEFTRANLDRLAKASADVLANPDEAEPYIYRGGILVDLGRFDDASKELDKAVSIAPHSAIALADRGMARAWKGDLEAAAKDLDAAYAIDPKNAVIFRARGFIAQRKGLWAEANAGYTAALRIEPNNGFALAHRAEINRAVGNKEAALRDAAAAIKVRPGWVEMYLLRANILRSLGRREEALVEANAVSSASPRYAYAHVVAANIFSAFNKDAEAMAAYDRALALKPEGYIYLNRALRRPKSDLAGRRADIDAALKLEPQLAEAIAAKANLQVESGDLTGAISTYSLALAKSADRIDFLVGRGIAFVRAGDAAQAAADFDRARRNASEPNIFNAMCWQKAIAGVALESALEDCNAALANSPDEAAFLDSRGLVLLRLGRLDEAITDYDRAIANSPNLPPSLYGRGVAWSRKGNDANAKRDTSAALAVNPEIRKTFETYGLTL